MGPEGDAVGVGNPESLVLESDFLLEQDFGENDYRIIGFDHRDSGCNFKCHSILVYFSLKKKNKYTK